MVSFEVVIAVVVTVFFVLLPVVLMLDFWGDERLTARGRPIRRPWPRSPRPQPPESRPEDSDLQGATGTGFRPH